MRAAEMVEEDIRFTDEILGFFEAGRPEYAGAQADVWRRIVRFLRSVA